MSSFVWGTSDVLVRGDVHIEPQTVGDLLRDLNVIHFDQDAQAEAVRSWLRANEPDDLLRVGLARRGFPTSSEPRVTSEAAGEVFSERGRLTVVFSSRNAAWNARSWTVITETSSAGSPALAFGVA